MKAVILAGGLGTRISEETSIKPKPMIEIGGRPILWHIMKLYSAHGVNDFVICCGYKGYVIKEYFANYFLHMSDVTFDMKRNHMEVHQEKAEPWRVTLHVDSPAPRPAVLVPIDVRSLLYLPTAAFIALAIAVRLRSTREHLRLIGVGLLGHLLFDRGPLFTADRALASGLDVRALPSHGGRFFRACGVRPKRQRQRAGGPAQRPARGEHGFR